MFIKETLYTV